MEKRCVNCMEPLEDAVCPKCNLKADENTTQTVLKNRYSVGKIFANTNESIVYLAYDNELQKKVFILEFVSENILKICEKEDHELLAKRFLNYAKNTAGLSLCNILPRTVDTFLENGTAYWVTDYFDGQSLKNLLSAGVKISSANTLNIVFQLLRGLRTIHSSGYIFGTISPKTLYILKNGEIRLFGVGGSFYSFADDLNCKAELLNPSYAAPELFTESEKITPASDVYSVAAIFYRIIAGKIPPISFLRSGGDNLLSLKKRGKNITPATKTALLNALNWQTKKRTKTPDAFLKELSATTVKRQLSGRIIWANILGFLQNAFDKFLFKFNAFSKSKSDKKPKNKKKSLLWLWITAPAVVLVGLIILLISLFSANDINHTASNSGSEEWYYGSGIETPNTNSTYSYGGYTSKNQNSSKGNSSNTSSLAPHLTECPDLTNYHISQVEFAVKDNSLFLGEITYVYSSDVTKDYIISQSIKSGTIIKKGSKIDIVVSKGSKEINLPEIVGLEMQKGIEALKNSGFNNIELNFVLSGDAVGSITNAVFENEAAEDTNEKVIVTVSGERAEVLDYVDKTVSEMKAADSDFVFEFILANGSTSDQNIDYSSYTVVSQSSEKNSPAYKGMTITLTIVEFND